jgi:hypothetical protein
LPTATKIFGRKKIQIILKDVLTRYNWPTPSVVVVAVTVVVVVEVGAG